MSESIGLSSINERDAYGFKKSNQHISKVAYLEWERSYKKEIEKAEKKWAELFRDLKSSGREIMPEADDKLKKMIRKGIPNQYRRKIWLYYSGAQDKMLANEGIYLSMLQREKDAIERRNGNPKCDKANEFIDVIERDINRTFPDNIHFQPMDACPTFTSIFTPPPYIYTTSLLHSLRRVLVAYSFYNSDLGYCQSMNYVAGLLLLFMPEEEAFWMLVTIIDSIMPSGMYAKNMSGTVTEMKVVMDVVKSKCKAIFEKVRKGGIVDLDMLISPWFLTIYINVLPIESVLRFWDCLFYEGNKILYRVALSILKLNEDTMLKIKDPVELVQFIQNSPKRMIDVQSLMNAAFQRFGSRAIGHLSEKDISKKRASARKEPSKLPSFNGV